MANRNLAPLKGSVDRGIVLLAGSATIGDSGAVTVDSMVGAAIAKSATGEYTITLEDKFSGLLACVAQVESSSAVDLVTQVKSQDVSSAKTVVIRTHAAGVATQPSSGVKLHIVLVLKDSSVLPNT